MRQGGIIAQHYRKPRAPCSQTNMPPPHAMWNVHAACISAQAIVRGHCSNVWMLDRTLRPRQQSATHRAAHNVAQRRHHPLEHRQHTLILPLQAGAACTSSSSSALRPAGGGALLGICSPGSRVGFGAGFLFGHTHRVGCGVAPSKVLPDLQAPLTWNAEDTNTTASSGAAPAAHPASAISTAFARAASTRAAASWVTAELQRPLGCDGCGLVSAAALLGACKALERRAGRALRPQPLAARSGCEWSLLQERR